MSTVRTERIGAEMKKNISEILQNGLQDTELTAMVSVMNVDVVRDLKHATIKLSIYGDPQVKQKNFDAVCAASWYIRRELAHRMKDMRIMPELHFALDENLDYSDKINRLLNKLKEEK